VDKGAESSEDDVEDEVGDRHLDEITIDTLQGTWKHSLGMTISAKGSRLKFENGEKYDLVVVGNTVELMGWKAVPEKSSANTIKWHKADGSDGGEISWSFQSDNAPEGSGTKNYDDGLEAMDDSNIVTSKRRRTKCDYVRMNRLLGGKGPKRAKTEADAPTESPEPEPEPEPIRAPKPEVPMTEDDVASAAAELQAAGKDLKPRRYMLPLVERLLKFDMSIEVLSSTKIGKAMHPYRKHQDPVIAQKVSSVISHWKALIKR